MIIRFFNLRCFVCLIVAFLLVVGFINLSALAQEDRCNRCNMTITNNMNTAIANINGTGYIECNVVCALRDVIDYGNGNISTNCWVSDDNIEISILNGELYSITPTSSVVLYNNSYMRDKIFSNDTNAQTFIDMTSWAANDVLYSMADMFEVLLQDTSSETCASCGNLLSRIRMTVVYDDLSQEHYCCPSCGFAHYIDNEDRIFELFIMSYFSNKTINAEDAHYVESYFTDSPCCEDVWIPFENHSNAERFLFMNGGRIVDFNGTMIITGSAASILKNPWLYLGIAVICITFACCIYYLRRKSIKPLRITSKSLRILNTVLVIVITFCLATTFSLGWRPPNFDHRVMRLTIDDNGEYSVAGQLEVVTFEPNADGHYVVGFHFFNIIRGGEPINMHLKILNDTYVNATFYALDGDKFNKDSQTRLNLGFGNSFNLDIALKISTEEYVGGLEFSNHDTGEVFMILPIYVFEGGMSASGGACHG
jgi:hypothetical protein